MSNKKIIKIDTSEKNINKNIALGLVYKPLSMLLSYLYIPVALAYLGDEKYGVWATVLSVLSWISLFDIGIGNGLRNKLAENLKNYDSLKTRKYVSSAYIMLTIIVMILMIVTVSLFSLVNWKSFFKVEANFSDNLTIVMNISIICMCVSFVMEICKSVYLALQKNHITNLMGLVQQALMLSSVVVLKKYTNGNLVFVAIAYGISNLVVELFFTLKLFKYNRDFIPKVKYFSREEAKDTTGLGIQFFIIQIAAMILYATDNIIITQICGPVQVTPYTTANKLFSMITAVFSIMIAPYWSAITVRKVDGDIGGIKKAEKKMLRLWGMATIGCIFLIIVFKPVVHIWLQRDMTFQQGLIPLMAVYAIVYMWNAVYSQIGNGLSLMKVSVIIAIIQSIVNVIASIFLGSILGMKSVGVLLGTVIAMLVSSIVMPIYIKKYLSKI